MFKEFKQSAIVFITTLIYQFAIYFNKPLSDVSEIYLAFMVSWGGVLFRDFSNPHPPLNVLVWGYIFKIIPASPMLLLIVELAIYSFICVVIYHICRNIGLPKKYSLFASFLFIFSRIWISMIFYGDSYSTLFITIGILVFLKYIDSPKPSLIFIVGLLFGISIMYKQNIGAYSVVAVVIYSLYTMVKNKKISFELAYLFLGVSTVIALVSSYFYYKGALYDFIYMVLLYPFEMQKIITIPCSPINAIYLIIEVSVIGILLFRYDKKILFLSLITLFLLLRNTPVCYSYSSISAMSPFAVLVAYILYHRARVRPYIKPITIIITIIFIGMYLSEANRLYSEVAHTRVSNHYHWLDYSDREIVKFLKSNTNSSDKILTIPADYSMNIATERQTMKHIIAGVETISPKFQDDMITNLKDVKYIVFLKNPDDSYACFQILFDYINTNYRIVKEIDNVILLEKGNNTEPIFQSHCKETLYISNTTLEDNKIVFHSTPRPPSIGYYNRVLNSITDKVKQYVRK